MFLEGLISFISPCLLPLLPVYLSYFAGQDSKSSALINSAGFVLGFTFVFVPLGFFAGAAGALLRNYGAIVNIVSGIIVIAFGLSFLGVINIPVFKGLSSMNMHFKSIGFLSSLLFGIVFSISWTPCIGAFLGSALMLAANSDSALKGLLMLLCYSLGLGLPFILSAVLIHRVKLAFSFFKKHGKLISAVSGALLIATGVLMLTGRMNLIFAAFSGF